MINNQQWDRLQQDNPIVAGILRGGGTAEDCCVALDVALQSMATKAMNLSMIAPRKMKMGGGRVMIWRCPDDLIPVSDTSCMAGLSEQNKEQAAKNTETEAKRV